MAFETMGLMIDCSRGAVPTVTTLKRLIDLLAAMGYNRLELYTEDTYEIEGRPYFGYLRGRYTAEEIKSIDAYAVCKGVELVPCIQVLAHLNQIFRWADFQNIRDCNDILLVDEPETYNLIDDMFRSVAANFSSRHINIGCDEAHMVGLGKFLDRFGYQNRFEIINRHLGKVLQIAKKYGFSCSMWSDMYFRLAFGGQYYLDEEKSSIPLEAIKRIPKGISLIYWDYYHTDVEHYRRMFSAHSKLGRRIEFAGGAWKWTGLTPDNRYSIKCADASVSAAREYGISAVMLTAWGDSGAEASVFSILPTLYYFSQLCLHKRVLPDALEKGFKKLIGVGFSDFLRLEEINRFPWNTDDKKPSAMRSFLYEDCFLGYNDRLITGGESEHFRNVIKLLKNGKYGKFSYVFRTMIALAKVLEIKADLGVRTRKIYQTGDKFALKELVNDYAVVIRRISAFHRVFEKQWYIENKPFGFELHDGRIGGIMCRLDSCRRRLLAYCDGKIESIPELNEDIPPRDEK